ncbi:short chain dehydrogenase [Aestuariivirga litoralis]|uniref:short chain dehydrogenase n=1 Tax=Aestuariivirga litoralis TaxID=2650924 RepID=UPI0018C60445|nr:short chain dehydrogenase [Aestuariivirga litoralis]MBG1233110.1 short chain dehydrogenase [Aestuariivirga litoralis]
MRILVVGGTGAVGKAAVSKLSKGHEIILAGGKSGDIQVNVMDEASVSAMYAKLGKLDAVVACTGHSHFGPVAEMGPKQFLDGLKDKVMGQINLVLLGMAHVNDGGSFTLTSGILSYEPIRQGSNAAACDGAIDSFAIGAAIEMPRGIRINAVSPGLLEAAAQRYDGYFPGHIPVSNDRVGYAYAKSIEGAVTGQVIRCE